MALRSVPLRLAFHEHLDIAAQFVVLVYKGPFSATRDIVIFRKPLPEHVKLTLATVVTRREFFEHVAYLIESTIRLLLLFF
jgi:hypothetical protein